MVALAALQGCGGSGGGGSSADLDSGQEEDGGDNHDVADPGDAADDPDTGGGHDADVGTPDTEEDVVVGPATLTGAVEKGPFVLGSSVAVSAVDSNGVLSGQVFNTETENDLGEFSLTVVYRGLVSMEGTGFYYNEATGQLSTAQLTLRGFHEVTDQGDIAAHLNVVTHLSHPRVRALLAEGTDLSTATEQAEDELRAALHVGTSSFDPASRGVDMTILGGDDDASAYLFAASAVLAQAAIDRVGVDGPVDATLQELLNTLGSDLEDGTVADALQDELLLAQTHVDTSAMELSLQQRIDDLGSSATVPDLDRVIDTDLDDVANLFDNCPVTPNTDQTDTDLDGIGDACDCGNAVVDIGEECDDGNAEDNDGCSNTCTANVCGDTVLNIGEECDDGNDVDTDECPGTCLDATCGDGFLWTDNETCDDGNLDDSDECPTSCAPAFCGDGFVLTNPDTMGVEEQCDGALDCRPDCIVRGCGNGVYDLGEVCPPNAALTFDMTTPLADVAWAMAPTGGEQSGRSELIVLAADGQVSHVVYDGTDFVKTDIVQVSNGGPLSKGSGTILVPGGDAGQVHLLQRQGTLVHTIVTIGGKVLAAQLDPSQYIVAVVETSPGVLELVHYYLAESYVASSYPLTVSTSATSFEHIELADINGDNHFDAILTPTGEAAIVAWGDGNGAFTGDVRIGTDPAAGRVRTFDIDGDGDTDLVEGGGAAPLVAHLNSGSGTFAAPLVISDAVTGGDLLIGDFDSDGTPDVGGGSFAYAPNQGGATFGSPVWLTTPNTVARGDLSAVAGGCNLALAWVDGVGSTLTLWHLNSDDGSACSEAPCSEAEQGEEGDVSVTACLGGTGVCDANGDCVACTMNPHCGDDNPCTIDTCADGSCSNTPDEGAPCGAGMVCDAFGSCMAQACVPGTCPTGCLSRLTLTRADGASAGWIEYAYHPDGRLLEGVVRDGSGVVVSRQRYSSDSDGNPERAFVSRGDGASEGWIEYTTDASGRIVGARRYDASGVLLNSVEAPSGGAPSSSPSRIYAPPGEYVGSVRHELDDSSRLAGARYLDSAGSVVAWGAATMEDGDCRTPPMLFLP